MPAQSPPLLDGRMTIGTGSNSVSISIGGAAFGAPFPITAGNYFLRSHTSAPPDAAQLMERFDLDVTAAAAWGAGDLVLFFDPEAGLMSILNNNAATIEIRFEDHNAAGDVEVGTMLGLVDADSVVVNPTTGVIAGGGGIFTGPVEPYYIWRPSVTVSTKWAPLSYTSVLRSDARVSRAPSGRTVGTKFFEQRDWQLVFRWLPLINVHALSANGLFRSFTQFWQRILSTHTVFRYYAERGNWTILALCVSDEATAQAGTTEPRVVRSVEDFDDLWDVTLSGFVSVA